jgi:hypothetical protein
MDPSEPDPRKGTTDAATRYATLRGSTRRSNHGREYGPGATSQDLSEDYPPFGVGEFSYANNPLPSIIEVPDSGEREPRNEEMTEAMEYNPTPLTGMSSAFPGSPQHHEDGVSVASGDEMDSGAEAAMDGVLMGKKIASRTICAAMKDRVRGSLDRALRNVKGPPVSDKEYVEMLEKMMELESERYVAKCEARRLAKASGTPSLASTTSLYSAAGRSINKDHKGKGVARGTPPGDSAHSTDNDHGQVVDQVSKTEIVPPSGAPTAPTESTSVPGDNRPEFYKPRASDWQDRVNGQRARDDALRHGDRTTLPDRGIRFKVNVPYDIWHEPDAAAKDIQPP